MENKFRGITTPKIVVCVAYAIFWLLVAVFSWIAVPYGQVRLVFGWMPIWYVWVGLWALVTFVAYLYYYLAEGRHISD